MTKEGSMAEWKEEIRRRLAGLALDPAREMEIVEELSQHLDDRYAELLAGGASEEQARRVAIAELIDSEMLTQGLRRVERQAPQEPVVLGARRRKIMTDLQQDLRYGLRILRRNPGFAAVAVLTLALGIGANTAIFSVVNAAMLRPLPFAESDRLVRLYESNPERGWPIFSVSHPNFLDWKAQNQTFDWIASAGGANLNLGPSGEIEVIRGTVATAEFLPALGVTPALGRNFLPEEDRPGGNTRVALLTHGSWQRRFGGDPDVVGKTLVINDNPFTIVGVLPESYSWGPPTNEMVVPLAPDPNRSRGDHRLLVIGKLKSGVTLDQALSDLNTIAGQLAQQYPESNKGWSVGGQSFYDWFIPETDRRSLLIFVGAVVFVLLIACSNVANLMLARAAARQKEFAIRMALGAWRLRVIRQLLVESLLLAIIAGGLGVGLAVLAVNWLKTMNPDNLPRIDEASIDGRVLVFALLTSLLTGVIFGLVPAIQASRPNLNESLKEGGRGAGGVARGRVRSGLVVLEVGLSVALLVCAGLLLRSFWRLQDVKPGFEPNNLLTMRVNLPRTRYQENPQAWSFYERLLAETKALPGIQSSALSSLVPLGGGNTAGEIQIEGKPTAPDGTRPSADWRIVSPGYFRTLGVPLQGRDFDERDTEKSQPVIIISQQMARLYWPDEDPVGKTVLVRSFGMDRSTIVGVAGDVKNLGLDSDPRPMVYVPTAKAAMWNPMFLVIRSSNEPTSQTSAVRDTVRAIDPNVPIYDIQTLEQMLSNSLGPRRFTMFLLGCFACVALVLACVGLFGVMAYLVSQRSHEIGVRLALGAQPNDVFRLIVGRGLLLAVVGAGLGLAGAFWLVRFLEDLLFQIKTTDALTFTIAPILLLVVALLACYVPARRAMKVDPIVALRYE
jgi:putative ABC transport system permease protein